MAEEYEPGCGMANLVTIFIITITIVIIINILEIIIRCGV